MTLEDVERKIRDTLGDAVLGRTEFRGEVSLEIAPDRLREAAGICRDALGFDYLVDISSIDHYDVWPRWEIVYGLYAMDRAQHFRLRIKLDEDNPEADTVSDLWPTADWHEREVFDMMGIRFRNHPDLRRILMWEGYPFHPLRKDFPLEGRASEMPDVAFSDAAPLEGGPFVTAPTSGNTQVREPRARTAGELPPEQKFLAEP